MANSGHMGPLVLRGSALVVAGEHLLSECGPCILQVSTSLSDGTGLEISRPASADSGSGEALRRACGGRCPRLSKEASLSTRQGCVRLNCHISPCILPLTFGLITWGFFLPASAHTQTGFKSCCPQVNFCLVEFILTLALLTLSWL